jgi:hypothetical protein
MKACSVAVRSCFGKARRPNKVSFVASQLIRAVQIETTWSEAAVRRLLDFAAAAVLWRQAQCRRAAGLRTPYLV